MRNENEALKKKVFWASFSLEKILCTLNERVLCTCTGCQESGRIFQGVAYPNIPRECSIFAAVSRAAKLAGLKIFEIPCGTATAGCAPEDVRSPDEGSAHLLSVGPAWCRGPALNDVNAAVLFQNSVMMSTDFTA